MENNDGHNKVRIEANGFRLEWIKKIQYNNQLYWIMALSGS